ncbi:MAG: hypothetical protein A2X94_04920 [Bdellovibrionales bacterium GWB1_55_8]|nr:MAG: hypothetical protein A2X94_04920 [Bdellovibrionales bacterium GWB1_55_8]
MRLKLFTLATLSSLSLLSPVADACDVVKLTVDTPRGRFAASGIVLDVRKSRVIVTADHFIPLDQTGFTIRAKLGSEQLTNLKIVKRDWAADMMILQPDGSNQGTRLERLKSCEGSEARKLESAVLRGYPLQDDSEAARDALVADTASPEIRIARPLRQIKVLALAEKGMSGGALLNAQGKLLGLVQKEWTSLTESTKGGALVLASKDLIKHTERMLGEKNDSIEMPLPFAIRRGESELQVAGFRFRDRPDNQIVASAGGGHPDGIGGAVPDSGVEVVGLTGEQVPESLQAMERVLRRAQAKGGAQMVVRETADGGQINDIIALARAFMTAETPELDYALKDVVAPRASGVKQTPESLFEDAILGIGLLANVNSGLREYARAIQAGYSSWLKTRSVSKVSALFERESEFQAELDRVLDIDPGSWSKVVEFQTTMLRLRKLLHQD